MYAHLAFLKIFWPISRQKQREIKTESKQTTTKQKLKSLKIREILFRHQNGGNSSDQAFVDSLEPHRGHCIPHWHLTVWKFKNFSIIRILREINF